ncbi:MAG: HAMP domain-containing histidine kinase [Anaerolineae bacterium]|nr:HAMP domain-containing histidine kinase [Anaerolineae bacterium]
MRERRGTGSGTCIVKNLVELQGGRVNVESQSGKGTMFRFTASS